MKVVFLCGGIGKRMLPITEDKFLLKFLGKTLLEHQIDLARGAGLDKFVIVANPGNVATIEALATGIDGIAIDLAMQEEPTGIAGALQSAAGLLDSAVLVVSANDVFDGSAYAALLDAAKGGAVSYVIGQEVAEYFPGGYLEVDRAGNLKHIVEKPGAGNEPSNLVNVLLHFHKDPEKLLRYIGIARTDRDDVYERALDGMARSGEKIGVVPYAGPWTPIKYPWHVLSVVRQLLHRSPAYVAPTAQVSDRAVLDGHVVIDENVKVFENAVIRGPVYIGRNSVIGNSCLVREYSHVGADCVVGFSTEVKGSYIGDGCWLHMDYVGDAVIGERCSFGANTVFANWRFDEKNVTVSVDGGMNTGRDKLGAIVGNDCRTGVNVSLMPGVRVGPNSIVGPQVCLTHDLEPDTMVFATREYRKMKNRLQRGSSSSAARMRALRGGGDT